MSENTFPRGWNEERVRKVLDHYESQTDEEALVDDEARVLHDITISLPNDLKEFVHEQVSSRRYTSISDYVRHLVEQDRVEAFLREGIESGDSTEMTSQDWKDIQSEGLQRLEARKLQKST